MSARVMVCEFRQRGTRRTRLPKNAKKIIKGLKRVDRSQIIPFFSQVGSLCGFNFKMKPKAVREANARGGKTEWEDEVGSTYRRWCENCGESFSTICETRRLCDKCHDEICETLGIEYANFSLGYKGGK